MILNINIFGEASGLRGSIRLGKVAWTIKLSDQTDPRRPETDQKGPKRTHFAPKGVPKGAQKDPEMNHLGPFWIILAHFELKRVHFDPKVTFLDQNPLQKGPFWLHFWYNLGSQMTLWDPRWLVGRPPAVVVVVVVCPLVVVGPLGLPRRRLEAHFSRQARWISHLGPRIHAF